MGRACSSSWKNNIIPITTLKSKSKLQLQLQLKILHNVFVAISGLSDPGHAPDYNVVGVRHSKVHPPSGRHVCVLAGGKISRPAFLARGGLVHLSWITIYGFSPTFPHKPRLHKLTTVSLWHELLWSCGNASHYWPLVRGKYRLQVISPHKGPIWGAALHLCVSSDFREEVVTSLFGIADVSGILILLFSHASFHLDRPCCVLDGTIPESAVRLVTEFHPSPGVTRWHIRLHHMSSP